MKQKRTGHKIYGLRARFRISLIGSLVISVILFFVLFGFVDDMILNHNQQLGNEEVLISKQLQSLQDFIDENSISSKDLSRIKEWEYVRPVILLEIYSDNECIYSSLEEDPEFSIQEHSNERNINTTDIHLTDKDVRAELYMDLTYQYYLLGFALSAVISVIVFIVLFMLSTYKLIRYLRTLKDEVQILEGGNLDYPITVKGNDEVTDLAISMNSMRESLRQQMETEQRLHDSSKQMVTEMSHDLRTPLTGIMLYTEILRSGHYSTDEELKDYLSKIDAKAHQMKEMSDHLLEYSLDGVPAKQEELQTMEQAFGEAIKDFREDLKIRGYDVISEDNWVPCFVQTKKEYVKRMFDNIASNITKYADIAGKVYLEILNSDEYCGFSVINSYSVDTESVDGNGVGIESIRSMMKQMGGTCTVEQTESEFEITVMFPKK